MKKNKEIVCNEDVFKILDKKIISKRIKKEVKKHIKYCRKYFKIKGKIKFFFVEDEEGILGEHIRGTNNIMIMLLNILKSDEKPFDELLFTVVAHEFLHVFFSQTFPTMSLEDQETIIYSLEEFLCNKKYS